MNVAWKFTTSFNDKKHLFTDKIKTDYLLDAFSCSCGHEDIVLITKIQSLDYICPECDNNVFYNANNVRSEYKKIFAKYPELLSSFNYVFEHKNNELLAAYSISIPSEIDFLRNKILYSDNHIYSIKVTKDFEFHKNYEFSYNENIFKILKEKIDNYLQDYVGVVLPNAINKRKNYDTIKFFFMNDHLKDKFFYYWTDVSMLKKKSSDVVSINDALAIVSDFRKENSVKKAVYLNYTKQLFTTEKYEPTYVSVFCKIIKDPNLLIQLLNNTELYKIYDDRDTALPFFIFMKSHYSDKEIVNFINTLRHYEELMHIQVMYEEISDDIDLYFTKPKCRVEAMHNEIMYCQNKIYNEFMENNTYNYTNLDYEACQRLNDGYDVRLPKDTIKLVEWGDFMHNCVAYLNNNILKSKAIVYGFFKEDTLVFIVHLEDDEIIEAKGKYNKVLSRDWVNLLDRWHKDVYVKVKERDPTKDLGNV